MNRFSVREHSSSILVAGLGSAFGVTLLLVTGDLATLISHSQAGDHASVHAILSFIALVFVAIALYTASVVTANTFATIIAGRTRTIALLRLIGASARGQRAAVAREGLLVGLVGAGLGLLVGIGANALLLAISMATGFVPSFAFGYFDPLVLLPVAAVVLTTWLASWASSRRVLVVSPMQAIGAAEERTTAEAAGRPGRTAFAIVLFVVGTLVLLGGVAIGQSSSQGLLVAVLGGMISFTGVVLAAGLIIPPALRLVGRAFGGSAPARLAAQNAVRYPERSARTTVGIVIGVTLITMFSVATQTFLDFADAARRVDPEEFQGVDQLLSVLTIIFTIIGGFSALIAAIGMVNNLSLSVLQRTRELGLLRALGFTARQVRSMILAESGQLAIAAVALGLLLGTLYGWAGAVAMLGSNGESGGLRWPAFPPLLLVAIVVTAALLTWAASVAPSRRATRIAPVEALAVE